MRVRICTSHMLSSIIPSFRLAVAYLTGYCILWILALHTYPCSVYLFRHRIDRYLAGAIGIEPMIRESKSRALPLGDTPIWRYQ